MVAPLPFITIAIPTYKRVEFLRQAIQSALSQDYPSFEIIVHDDTPDDSLRTIVESFATDKIQYRQNRPPLGLVPKLNDFLSLSKGEWMVVLCDDDVFDPGFLRAIGTLAAAHPDAGFVRTRYKVIDREGNITREDAPCPAQMSPFQFASRFLDIKNRLCTVNVTGVAFRPKTLAALGGFASFHRGFYTDYLAWFSLGSTATTFCDERALCSIRMSHGSITMGEDTDFEAAFETSLRMLRESLSIIERLETQAKTAEERTLMKECRRNLDVFFSRTLNAYDTAFEQALLNQRWPMEKFRRVFGVMHSLKVPFYPRIALYLLLTPTPRFFREKVLRSFIEHRRKRTLEYYKKFGLGI